MPNLGDRDPLLEFHQSRILGQSFPELSPVVCGQQGPACLTGFGADAGDCAFSFETRVSSASNSY